jgi:hypothetical protein
MKLKLPLQAGPRYLTNHGDVVTFRDDGDGTFYSDEVKFYFDDDTGKAGGTDTYVTEQLSTLTLPPVIGKRYVYRHCEGGEFHCEIISTQRLSDGTDTYKSRPVGDKPSASAARYRYWPDGEAKRTGGNPPVAVLIEDVHTSELEALQHDHTVMMARLKELET